MKPTVTGLVVLAVLFPAGLPPTQAQPTVKVYRVGVISPLPSSPEPPTVGALRQGLRELGYVDGKNVILETKFAEGHSERFPQLVTEMIRLKVDVLVVGSTVGALAAKRATTTVPVVFAGLIDPVAAGVVTSLAHPGGNITGVTFGIGGTGFGAKWLDLLKEAAPDVSHVAVLWNSANPGGEPLVREIRAAAGTLRVRVEVLDAGDPMRLDTALAAIGRSGARGIIVTADPFFIVSRTRLVQFAATKRLVAVYFSKDFVDAGGLMSYGSTIAESYRRAATHVGKILKGTKPADLPIDQPTKFELVINLQTARALGRTVPQTLLVQADHVIE